MTFARSSVEAPTTEEYATSRRETNGGPPSNVSVYSCVPSWSETGPEVIHRVTTTVRGDLQAALSGLESDLDVFIVKDCDASRCEGHHDNTAVYADAPAGTYYVVVDGYLGAAGAYTLTVTSHPCRSLNCNDGNPCTTDTCNPSTGACEHNPVNCDDGNPCTTDACIPA